MKPSSQTALVVDQLKIRIDEDLVRRGAPGFPRSLDWWKRNTPLWLDVAESEQGRIILEPNGRQANGTVREVTPALRRRHLQYVRNWAAGLIFLDLSDAIVIEGGAR
ncbi:hypothetical protein [Streptomyces pseudogriseolus]|uniref:hypothetical protein n=1 Tax=Streptomyces pseudogriseolus TaxID=36817 RepID=UPI003FA23FFB